MSRPDITRKEYTILHVHSSEIGKCIVTVLRAHSSLVNHALTGMQACNRQSAYCVPLYDTLGSDAVRYIINHAEVTIVFADSLKLPALVQPLKETKGQVTAVVYWGEPDTLAKVVCPLFCNRVFDASSAYFLVNADGRWVPASVMISYSWD